MEKTRRDRLLNYSILSVLILFSSQLALSFLNSENSLFERHDRYTGAAYGLMAVYLASLFLLDALIYFVKSPTANQIMKRYFAVACAFMAVWLLFHKPLMSSESGGSILTMFLIFLITPYASMLPAGHLIFFRGLGLEWSALSLWHSVLVFSLCAAHLIYFSFLSRRDARGKEKKFPLEIPKP